MLATLILMSMNYEGNYTLNHEYLIFKFLENMNMF